MPAFTPEQLARVADAVRSSYSIAGVLRCLGLRVGGANYDTVKRAVRTLQLDTSHWTGEGHRKGSRVPVVPARPLHLVLVRGVFYSTYDLKRRLLAQGLFEARCVHCGLAEWRGGNIPLELDHIDGDRTNNELQNLRLLCPNCHAMTPTYRAKNKGKNPLR